MAGAASTEATFVWIFVDKNKVASNFNKSVSHGDITSNLVHVGTKAKHLSMRLTAWNERQIAFHPLQLKSSKRRIAVSFRFGFVKWNRPRVTSCFQLNCSSVALTGLSTRCIALKVNRPISSNRQLVEISMDLQFIRGAPLRMSLRWTNTSCKQHIPNQIVFIPIACCLVGLRSYWAKITLNGSLRSEHLNNISIAGFNSINLDIVVVNRMYNYLVSSIEALRPFAVDIYSHLDFSTEVTPLHLAVVIFSTEILSSLQSNNKLANVLPSIMSHQLVDQLLNSAIILSIFGQWNIKKNFYAGNGFNGSRSYTYCHARSRLDIDEYYPQLNGLANSYSTSEHSGSHQWNSSKDFIQSDRRQLSIICVGHDGVGSVREPFDSHNHLSDCRDTLVKHFHRYLVKLTESVNGEENVGND